MLHCHLRLRQATILLVGVLLSSSPCDVAAEPVQSQQLVAAAEAGDSAQVTALLEAGEDPNQCQPDGSTPIHWSVHRDDLEMTRCLLAAGADPKLANAFDVVPLALACENGNSEIVAVLLAAGADPQTALPGNETPLHTAARSGNPDVIAQLLKAGADLNAKEHRQQTAVMWGTEAGHLNVVQLLVQAGADISTPLGSGFTPFFFAVREGHRDIVNYYLEQGQEIDQTLEPTRSFRKQPRAGMTALVLAIENGHFDLAQDLLKAGANPNSQSSGYSPLHVLTWVRKPNRGDGEDGDPSPIGSGRMTSLQLVDALVEHGADPNIALKSRRGGRGRINHRGATPLLFAAKTADLPLIKRLVGHGADPLLPNADDCTPLMAAAGLGTIAPAEEAGTENEALATVDFLLEHGADVNHVDRNGETAMHGAAYKSFPRMVKRLDAAGASIEIWNKKNKYKWTPLLIAEGHRVGNFKPSFETLAAIKDVMRKHGLTPPPPTPRVRRKGYE